MRTPARYKALSDQGIDVLVPPKAAPGAAPLGGGLHEELALRTELRRNPRNQVAVDRLAFLLEKRGERDEAIDQFARFLQASPKADPIRFAFARLLYRAVRFQEALDQIAQMSAAMRATPDVRTFEAGLLGSLGRHEPQCAIYRKLLKAYPNHGELWVRLGTALKYAGEIDPAVEALRKAVTVQPGLGEGWWNLANMKTFRFTAEDIAAMRKLLGGSLAPIDKLQIHFALGRALEQEGAYEQSFAEYAQGNSIRAALSGGAQTHSARITDYVDRSIALFDRAFLSGTTNHGHQAADPIFIVGMQRGGSTLIEQILASHSQVEGTSELEAMVQLWIKLEGSAQRAGRSVWDDIRTMEAASRRDLGTEYLERARQFRLTERPFFIDKRPANWMYTGLIRLILPNAKIIDARRHPMATGFSNFKQHYAAGANFAYSLEALGRYYGDYVRLMRHMAAVDPASSLMVLNEALIADTEAQVRRMLDFLGLPFEQACLDFHLNPRAVRTASADQVRRKINSEGVDHWRHYAPWLDPLRAALGPAYESWNEGQAV